MHVEVRTPLLPTEEPEKVAQALTAFLPGKAVPEDGTMVVVGHTLDHLRRRVWELRIIDTFRSALLNGCQGQRLHFVISKQAAYAGKVSLPAAPHPLGDLAWNITLEGEFDDAEALAWWLCPETKDGEVIGPTDAHSAGTRTGP